MKLQNYVLKNSKCDKNICAAICYIPGLKLRTSINIRVLRTWRRVVW